MDTLLAGGISYGRAALMTTAVLFLGIGAVLVVRRRRLTQRGEYLPLVALGALVGALVIPGSVPRYLIYGYVLLVLSIGVMDRIPYFIIVGVLTFTVGFAIYYAFVAVAGIFPDRLAVFLPANNPLSREVVFLYKNDRFITIAAAANTWVTAWLGLEAVTRLLSGPRVSTKAPESTEAEKAETGPTPVARK